MNRVVDWRLASYWLALGLCCLLPFQAVVAEATASPDTAESRLSPKVLLARMTEAVRSLSYEGTLVYLHQNQLETLSLDHRIADGQVEERLIALSGPIRAVASGKDRVNCVLTDGQPISVERQGGRFLDTEGIDPGALQDHYSVEYLGRARIAGRETEVVGILPRDDLRYGYRFHIDRETALPLKSDLIDRHQEPLEQLMFTSIKLNAPAAPGSETPPDPVRSVRGAPATRPSSQWRFEPMPAGFELVMQHQIDQADGSRVEHFLFTDRLSSYSIYIEPASDDGLEGGANIGSVHAAGRRFDEHQITAVGEVPLVTVQAAIASVHRAAPPTQ
ncbi:MucB/RseB C-terminal domain-containing protein [Allochromatium vinosum]|uniref:Sigma E regulatory protein, MucB/RseB n=1 Tax=Allochromatium vinosum (strain ATCC 17899 / DSM 180 / NBRC 103801 / NCIMB 10441 / D) TaxID=572477 RepID=D3RTZ7_ALLVD|nr:MucB/RseB C-terminal domain-containing protein [Allochromatium vinosum]ADC62656.1 sigma E regulatory protein, MucB/RseB [Allochromatium vinosum DSM 180]